MAELLEVELDRCGGDDGVDVLDDGGGLSRLGRKRGTPSAHTRALPKRSRQPRRTPGRRDGSGLQNVLPHARQEPGERTAV